MSEHTGPRLNMERYSAPADINNLPDVPKLLDEVVEIMTEMNTDEMTRLRDTDTAKYKSEMEKKFLPFAEKYFTLFQTIISGEDLTHLFNMFVTIDKIKRKEVTFEEGEKKLGEKLAKDYIKKADEHDSIRSEGIVVKQAGEKVED